MKTSPEVSPETLRAAFGHFATGVAVVTALGERGRRHGATANAVSSVSLDPPLLLVCLANTSGTLAALLQSRHFAVNVLHADQREVAQRFARKGSSWLGVHARPGRTGVPLLPGAVASLECALHDIADGGDHRIVVGRVLDVDHTAEETSPLVFYRSDFTTLSPSQKGGASQRWSRTGERL